MDVGYGVIVDVIKEFSTNVQEIEKFKIEMTERIISQMLQSEKENKQNGFTQSTTNCNYFC
jgi:hypothetical protein